jgi:DNA-binding CsgD family transcriptional regulator
MITGFGAELVERDEAVAALRGLLHGRAARNGAAGGRTVLLDGAVGSGKSALLARFAELARAAGATVLTASAAASERALPLSVLTQLLCPRELPAGCRDEALELLTDLARAEAEAGPDAQFPEVHHLHQVSMLLPRIARDAPLVLAVDDAQDADAASVRCLAYALRRLGPAPVLALLAEDCEARPVPADLLDQPNPARITLAPLSAAGAERLLAARLGPGRGARERAELAGRGGGSPLLLHALAGDRLSGGFETEYNRALLHCLDRGGPDAIRAARALAVLGGQASPDAIARLAQAGPAAVPRALRGLRRAGVLGPRGFAHPPAAALVLDAVAAEERAELHARAAELLRAEGAAPSVVAEQLLRAAATPAAWAAPMLLEAARDALSADRLRHAENCLRLAEKAEPEPATLAVIRAHRLRLGWQLRPGAAPDPGAGPATGPGTDGALWLPGWYGDLDALCAAWDRMREQAEPETGAAVFVGAEANGAADRERIAAGWLRSAYPRLARGLDFGRPAASALASGPAASGADLPLADADPWPRAVAGLAERLVAGRAEDAAEQAERVLQSLRLDHESLWSAECALLAVLILVYTGRLGAAAGWSERLAGQAESRGAPAWRALFTATGAETALRRGELTEAHRRAEHALTLIPPRGWGAALGLPLGTALLAAVRAGRREAADRYAAAPLPAAALESRHGAHLLHARGHYRLAAGHPQAALADFLACGALLDGWGQAGLGVAQWRAGAAEAWLRLGNPDRAVRLVREQLSRLPAGDGPARGQCLRVLAAADAAHRRTALLADAVDVLERCDDRYELARALTDYGTALRADGNLRDSRRALRRAWHLAGACGALPLCRQNPFGIEADRPGQGAPAAPLGHGHPGRTPATAAGRPAPRTLTEQQRRVAVLAAEGYTNPEIAARLSITASMVEQHLTRVFRKLGVKQRQELARHIQA